MALLVHGARTDFPECDIPLQVPVQRGGGPLKTIRVSRLSLLLLVCALTGLSVFGHIRTSAALAETVTDPFRPDTDLSFGGIPGESTQLLLAVGKNRAATSVVLYVLEKNRNGWTSPFPSPIKVVIGRNGFADPGTKREGDGKTPSGVYTLEFAFGDVAVVNTRMPYRKATEADVWVDDVDSPDYNRWISGKTDTSSFEQMRRNDGLYKYGIVIGYNTRPVVRGLGSAIFLHLWKGTGIPTSGCVAMAEKDLVRILAWLDPQKKPLIAMGEQRTISSLVK